MISERISDGIPLRMKKNEYGYPHSNALLQFCLKFERCKPQKAARHPTICKVINDVKQCPSRKYLTLSNQTSRYKIKCIRSMIYLIVLY